MRNQPSAHALVVRGNRMTVEKLRHRAEKDHERLGYFGLSVFAADLPLEELVRRAPLPQRWLQLSTAGWLATAGFLLARTGAWPHHTVQLGTTLTDEILTRFIEALDRLLGGTPKRVVLLTATPVNNALWDLYNLVMLFARHDGAFRGDPLMIPSLRELFIRAGARDHHQISEEVLFPLVDAVAVRRDLRFIVDRYQGETFQDGTPVRFPTPLLEEVRYDLDTVYPGVFRDVADTIGSLSMARYTPARYMDEPPDEVAWQEALPGLMQSQLLKRFESSAAAARQTLERMILAHEALLEAWGRDMVPSLTTLKDLVREAQEGEPLPDLVEASLEDDPGALPSSAFDPKFADDVGADLERLRGSRRRRTNRKMGDERHDREERLEHQLDRSFGRELS